MLYSSPEVLVYFQAQVLILAPPLTTCVTLGKLVDLLGLSSVIYKIRIIRAASLIVARD